MNRHRIPFCVPTLILTLFTVSLFAAEPVTIPESPDVLPIDQIRSGMKGYGVSRFQDNQLERMEVEILGIINNGKPEFSTILGRITGPAVDRGGIMSGMSGSPVYINGRLAGAMAYSFPFAKESICGITPMTAMDALWKPIQTSSAVVNRILGNAHRFFSMPGDDFKSVMVPIDTPMVCTGMTPDMVTQFRNLNNFKGLNPISGGVSGKSGSETLSFQPGDAVGVLFVDGDIRMAGMGTVTAVDGDQLLAFGHPMFNLGRCELPMVSGEVVSFVPSLAQSFKVINSGSIVGTIVNDGEPGIAGITGKIPDVVPVRVHFSDPDNTEHEFQFRVLRHHDYTAAFTAMALAGVLSKTVSPEGDRTYRFTIEADLNSGHQLKYRYMTGAAGITYEECYQAIARVAAVLKNPFEEVNITGINIQCDMTATLEIAAVESVRLMTSPILPGTPMEIMINLRGYRSGPHSRHLTLDVPISVQPGKYFIEVLDGEDYRKWQATRSLLDHEYNSFQEYLDNLDDRIVDDELYFMLRTSSRDVVAGGEILRNSPPTLQSLMSLPGTGAHIRESHRILTDKIVQFPFQVIGSQVLEMEVLPGKDGR